MPIRAICACLGCLLCLPASAAPPTPKAAATTTLAQQAQAVRILQKPVSRGERDVLTFVGTGRGKRRTAKFNAYETLLLRPDAPRVFRSLLGNPSIVTQMYALAGLRLTDDAGFDGAQARFRNRQDTVLSVSGTATARIKVSQAAESIRYGASPMGESLWELLNAKAQERCAPSVLLTPVQFSTHLFELSPRGWGAGFSEQVRSFHAIKRRADAPQVFQRFLRSPDIAVQLFGLTGLKQTDYAAFQKVAGQYVERQDKVSIVLGDIVFERPFGDCVRDLLEGRSPGRWVEPPPAPDDGVRP